MPGQPPHPAPGRTGVIQGAFRGGRPALAVQARPGPGARAVPGTPPRTVPGVRPVVPKPAPVAQPFRNGSVFPVPSTVNFAPRGAGQPLPPAVLQKMERFFGASFADVRVHVGPQAASIGALAFTMGSDLYFAPGQYDPHSAQGRRLLGHELTHVVQQRAGRVRNPLGSGVAVVQDPALEAEAERMGMRLVHAGGTGIVQAKVVRNRVRAGVIQCLQNITDAEWNGRATTLAADLEPAGGGATIDLGKFYSSGGNHAEDNLIAALPGGAAPGHYELTIVINRSPCSDIARTEPKGNGQRPCMERLIDLQVNGIGGTHTFELTVVYRHAYGRDSDQRAFNLYGVQQGIAAGIKFMPGVGHYDVGAAKVMSKLES